MTVETSYNPHKEEDEGYVAAEAGHALCDNPYPRGTIRFEEWARGWQIRFEENRVEKGEGYIAADAGKALSDNPHPRGTIRYAEWRSGWQVRTAQIQRAMRLRRDR